MIPLIKCPRKLFAEIRMGNVDQCLSSLLQRFAAKLRDTIFRDHIIGVKPGQCHRSSRINDRTDPGDARSVFLDRQRWQKQNCFPFAIFRQIHASDKIHLTADPGILSEADIIRDRLSHNIHLQCGIAAVPGEAHHVVLAIVYRSPLLFDGDVNCANIEDNSDLPLFLQ